MAEEGDAAGIWRQKSLPVIYRPGRGDPLLVKLPFRSNNRTWIRGGRQRKPAWNARYECWEVPNAWFEEVVKQALARFGRVYVIQPYKEKEVCAPACWNARRAVTTTSTISFTASSNTASTTAFKSRS